VSAATQTRHPILKALDDLNNAVDCVDKHREKIKSDGTISEPDLRDFKKSVRKAIRISNHMMALGFAEQNRLGIKAVEYAKQEQIYLRQIKNGLDQSKLVGETDGQ